MLNIYIAFGKYWFSMYKHWFWGYIRWCRTSRLKFVRQKFIKKHIMTYSMLRHRLCLSFEHRMWKNIKSEEKHVWPQNFFHHSELVGRKNKGKLIFNHGELIFFGKQKWKWEREIRKKLRNNLYFAESVYVNDFLAWKFFLYVLVTARWF